MNSPLKPLASVRSDPEPDGDIAIGPMITFATNQITIAPVTGVECERTPGTPSRRDSVPVQVEVKPATQS